MNQRPLINVHTHIFTSDDVPRFFARGVFPFSWILDLRLAILLAKGYFKCKPLLYRLNIVRREVLSSIRSHLFFHIPYVLVLTWLSINALYYLFIFSNWDFSSFLPDWGILDFFSGLLMKWVIAEHASKIARMGIIATAYILYKPLRKLIWKFLILIFRPLKNIPRTHISSFWSRYKNIIRFATYQQQRGVFDRLYKMYPPRSKMVVLPMDMEFMGAGSPVRSYLDQLKDLHELATTPKRQGALVPFIFVDPRRIRHDRKEGSSDPFFDWKYEHGKVVLNPCVLKRYLENDDGEAGVFKGIKIYPALGYYPFDEDLLPLWLYCQQRNIPITSHCIMGTVYNRNRLKKDGLRHPYLSKDGVKLRYRHVNRFEAQRNYTHPLNYTVLLEPKHLHQWLKNCRPVVANLFSGPGSELKNLSKLKINLAHYGGSEEWLKYLAKDRLEQSQELIEMPQIGLSFRYKQIDAAKHDPSLFYPDRLYDLWKSDVDWFSLISSMMLQYENVYADVSYTLHNPEIKPILSSAMKHTRLRHRILFGTDYYVVRSHDSEKGLTFRFFDGLEEDEIDLLARRNPTQFLAE